MATSEAEFADKPGPILVCHVLNTVQTVQIQVYTSSNSIAVTVRQLIECVCFRGAKGQQAALNHLQMRNVASRVALTGPNSLLTHMLANTSGIGWKSFSHRAAEVRDEGYFRTAAVGTGSLHFISFYNLSSLLAATHWRTQSEGMFIK